LLTFGKVEYNKNVIPSLPIRIKRKEKKKVIVYFAMSPAFLGLAIS